MDVYYAYLRLLIAFPLVIVAAYFGLRFLLSRYGAALSMGNRVRVVERVALGTRTFLYVVKVGKEFLLIAATSNGVFLLKDLGEAEEFAGEYLDGGGGADAPLTFAGLMERLKGKSFCFKNNENKEKFKEVFGKLSRNYKLDKKTKIEHHSTKNDLSKVRKYDR